jgi:hypothetical protein
VDRLSHERRPEFDLIAVELAEQDRAGFRTLLGCAARNP